MQVAFWSNSHKKSNTINNMIAISIASALILPSKILLLENYISKNNIDNILKNKKYNYIKEESICYKGSFTFESLLANSKNKWINIDYIKEILIDKLYYFSQHTIKNNDLFDYEMRQNIDCLIKHASSHTDLQYIGTSPTSSLSTKHILEESNLIIVNIYPDIKEIKKFISNYMSLAYKAIFIINVTDAFKCRQIYDFFKLHNIKEKRVVFLPYNEMLNYANYYGNMTEYIKLNIHCCRENKDYLYFKSLKKIVNLIEDSLINSKRRQICS